MSQDRVKLTLNGGEVTPEFRRELFDAAGRAGLSANEYALRAVAEKLAGRGRQLPGIFEIGDIDELKI